MQEKGRPKPKVTLTLSLDELRAELRVTPEGAKGRITSAELEAILAERDITFGIKTEALHLVAHNPGAFVQNAVVVAEGAKPVPGTDGYLEYFVEPTRHQAGYERADGTIDFHTISQFVEVSPDTPIATIRPPREGIEGRTVRGGPAYPMPPRPAKPKLGVGVALKDDTIVSTIGGHLTVDPTGKLMVQRVLEIRGDVDYHVGSIDHVGDVSVRGSVRAGFTVRAKGHVLVVGAVEAATIEAVGNIEIRGVVIPGARLLAGGDIKARALEGCTAQAQRNVEVDQDILHSEVHAGRFIVCTRGKGIILGGRVVAGLRLQANQLGNDVNMATHVEVGISPVIAKELRELHLAHKRLEAELRPIEANVLYLERQREAGSLPPSRVATLRAALEHKGEVEGRIAENSRRSEELKAEEANFGGQIDVQRRAHANVHIVIGTKVLKVDKAMGRFKAKLVEGEIKVST